MSELSARDVRMGLVRRNLELQPRIPLPSSRPTICHEHGQPLFLHSLVLGLGNLERALPNLDFLLNHVFYDASTHRGP